ncbi:MAG: CDP-alcohol phosphatidyltransferase family protein [Bryobacteraceae bacterium]
MNPGATETRRDRWLNPPNLITLLRLVLVPFVVRDILREDYKSAAAIFLFAAFTDAVDGFLARRFGWISRAGAYLDPVVDKIFLSAIFISLAIEQAIPWWFVALVFARDFLLLFSSALAMIFTRLRAFPPTPWGKLSTFFQILCAASVLFYNAVPLAVLEAAARTLLWLAAAATLWSGIHYGWVGAHRLRGHPDD